jgi:hypothetical protein
MKSFSKLALKYLIPALPVPPTKRLKSVLSIIPSPLISPTSLPAGIVILIILDFDPSLSYAIILPFSSKPTI